MMTTGNSRSDESLLRELQTLRSSLPEFSLPDDCGKATLPGEIRLVQAPSWEEKRLVLILEVFPRQHYAMVALLTNEIEMQSDSDALLRRKETGLPFDLVAQLDLAAPIRLIQSTSHCGQLASSEILDQLIQAANGYEQAIPAERRGLPIRGPSDPRWAFKKSEFEALQRLSSDCMADLLEGRLEPSPLSILPP